MFTESIIWTGFEGKLTPAYTYQKMALWYLQIQMSEENKHVSGTWKELWFIAPWPFCELTSSSDHLHLISDMANRFKGLYNHTEEEEEEEY